MDLLTAEQIVNLAIRETTGDSRRVDVDQTLYDIGLRDENQRRLFRMRVHHEVQESGHEIDPLEIPGEHHNTVLDVVQAVSSLAGRPTTGNEI
jgi:hypothetical protein